MQWVLLSIAIVLEVHGTLAMRLATQGRPAWYWAVTLNYAGAMVALSAGLAAGLDLGIGYGIWAATGVAIISVASRIMFNEPLTPLMVWGIALLAGGVLLIELGSTHK